MIVLNDIKCYDSKNELFLQFDKPIKFENNTMYFIIGRSGVGKSTFINMLTSPFTEDPIKFGEIQFDDEEWVPCSLTTRKPIKSYPIAYSASSHISEYYRFIRKHLAFIPQANASFHSSIPVAKQLYNLYSYAAVKPSKKEFKKLVEELAPAAGFDKVTVDNDLRTLRIWDYKKYQDIDDYSPLGEFIIVNKGGDGKNDKTIFAKNLSHGQRQRLLVLSTLIRFEVMDNPILLGDEFLVNFSFTEGELVLRHIIDKFKTKKRNGGNDPRRIAAFVFHDLSYPCIEKLKDEKEFDVRIMLIEQDMRNSHEKFYTEIELSSFFNDNKLAKPEYAGFRKFKDSYEGKAKELASGDDKKGLQENINRFKAMADENTGMRIFVKDAAEYIPNTDKVLYQNLNFPIKDRRFIILTGFSGCGKSQFISHLLNCYIYDKKHNPRYKENGMDTIARETFRYFPSTSHESLSYGSNVTVREDLKTIYQFYNGIDQIDNAMLKEKIKRHFENVQLSMPKGFDEFLDRGIYTLSGGELQRYWFGRITFMEGIKPEEKPSFLVFDESISSLDCMTKDDLIAYIIKDLFISEKFTIFFVTHDLRDIRVIYNTLKDNGLEDYFERYEMFGGKIFKALTEYNAYRENAYKSLDDTAVFNEYEEITESSNRRKLKLRLERVKQ